MEISRAGLDWIEQDKGWGGPSVQGPFDWYADANHFMASFLSEWTFLVVEQSSCIRFRTYLLLIGCPEQVYRLGFAPLSRAGEEEEEMR